MIYPVTWVCVAVFSVAMLGLALFAFLGKDEWF
jgi:hypothetical protein